MMTNRPRTVLADMATDVKPGQIPGKDAARIVDEAMKELALDEVDFQYKAGVSRQTHYRWREGLSNPRRRDVARAIAALGLDPKAWGLPVVAGSAASSEQPEWAVRLEGKLDALIEFHRTGDSRTLNQETR